MKDLSVMVDFQDSDKDSFKDVLKCILEQTTVISLDIDFDDKDLACPEGTTAIKLKD